MIMDTLSNFFATYFLLFIFVLFSGSAVISAPLLCNRLLHGETEFTRDDLHFLEQWRLYNNAEIETVVLPARVAGRLILSTDIQHPFDSVMIPADQVITLTLISDHSIIFDYTSRNWAEIYSAEFHAGMPNTDQRLNYDRLLLEIHAKLDAIALLATQGSRPTISSQPNSGGVSDHMAFDQIASDFYDHPIGDEVPFYP